MGDNGNINPHYIFLEIAVHLIGLWVVRQHKMTVSVTHGFVTGVFVHKKQTADVWNCERRNEIILKDADFFLFIYRFALQLVLIYLTGEIKVSWIMVLYCRSVEPLLYSFAC